MSKRIDTTILICPQCKRQKLNFHDDRIRCEQCGNSYGRIGEKYFFARSSGDDVTDPFDRLKHIFKKYHRFYTLLIYLVSPVYANRHLKKFMKRHINRDTLAINLGSGNSNLSEEIINVDLFPYPNVDMTCDIHHLPFQSDSVDIVITMAVLEHLPDPQLVVDEIYRVLKSDGLVYTFFPFIQGFHASPHDYSRQTEEGLKHLFRKFTVIETAVGGGPTSGFLWIFQEWLALLLSFGIKPLHILLNICLMLITFPLKFFDIVLAKYPLAKNISSGFIIVAKK
jgi:SAM-dependent methyltransferase